VASAHFPTGGHEYRRAGQSTQRQSPSRPGERLTAWNAMPSGRRPIPTGPLVGDQRAALGSLQPLESGVMDCRAGAVAGSSVGSIVLRVQQLFPLIHRSGDNPHGSGVSPCHQYFGGEKGRVETVTGVLLTCRPGCAPRHWSSRWPLPAAPPAGRGRSLPPPEPVTSGDMVTTRSWSGLSPLLHREIPVLKPSIW
jgi:hypothetical protein